MVASEVKALIHILTANLEKRKKKREWLSWDEKIQKKREAFTDYYRSFQLKPYRS
jgi:hypothetical protein